MSKLLSGSHSSMALLLQLAVIVLTALSLVNGATIDIINNCIKVKTACAAHGSSPTACYVLNGGGGKTTLDVGAKWEAGLIWAFPGNSGDSALGLQAKPQANLAEFTIGANGLDYYDISNVNAYNLPMKIAVTQIAGGGTASGTHCTPVECNIPYNTLATFCQAPNKLTGPPGEGCYNTDGPTTPTPTTGTQQFKAKCPNSYAWSKDDGANPPVVFGCNTGSNYEVVFCP